MPTDKPTGTKRKTLSIKPTGGVTKIVVKKRPGARRKASAKKRPGTSERSPSFKPGGETRGASSASRERGESQGTPFGEKPRENQKTSRPIQYRGMPGKSPSEYRKERAQTPLPQEPLEKPDAPPPMAKRPDQQEDTFREKRPERPDTDSPSGEKRSGRLWTKTAPTKMRRDRQEKSGAVRLWFPKGHDSRTAAIRVVLGVLRDGEALDSALDYHLERVQGLSGRDRGLAVEIATGTIRHLSLLDHLLGCAMTRGMPPKDHFLWAVLRTASYQIHFMRIPARAAVHEAVALVKKSPDLPRAGFINAVLRRVTDQDREKLLSTLTNPTSRRAITWSHPPWLVALWESQLDGPLLEQRLAANNIPGPLTLRVNTLVTNRQEALAAWGERARPTDFSPEGVVITGGGPIWELPGFKEGWFAVQDEAAQLVSRLLDPRPEEKILDACAAPGGKTAHLAALANNQAHITALDSNPKRLERVRENLERLQVQGVEVMAADAGDFSVGDPSSTEENPLQTAPPLFDKALVDAPCLGTGVIRRHPDIKWRRKRDSLERIIQEQARILNQVAAQVRPGGVLVYATCSLETGENEQQISHFLETHPEWQPSPLDSEREGLPEASITPRGEFRSEPGLEGMDGFFAARLVKNIESP
ncbi:MAG: 16S rRNA (cytosine(967)-C(5))-methyltransferase RsmB [Magnetococcales bacterium]|nr:16S rRNA (cytosine(967)-C(5))-methyltransferase RsmB [Magnetococcales bacterium]